MKKIIGMAKQFSWYKPKKTHKKPQKTQMTPNTFEKVNSELNLRHKMTYALTFENLSHEHVVE